MITHGDHTTAPLFLNRTGTPTERYRFLRLVHDDLRIQRNVANEGARGTHFRSLIQTLESYATEVIVAVENDW